MENIINGLNAKEFIQAQALMRTRVKDESFKAELDAIKDSAKEASKAADKAAKAAKAEAGKAIVVAAGVGGKVTVIYGKEEVEVTVRTLDPSKNTFGIRMEGNPSEKLWRYFHQVVI